MLDVVLLVLIHTMGYVLLMPVTYEGTLLLVPVHMSFYGADCASLSLMPQCKSTGYVLGILSHCTSGCTVPLVPVRQPVLR